MPAKRKADAAMSATSNKRTGGSAASSAAAAAASDANASAYPPPVWPKPPTIKMGGDPAIAVYRVAGVHEIGKTMDGVTRVDGGGVQAILSEPHSVVFVPAPYNALFVLSQRSIRVVHGAGWDDACGGGRQSNQTKPNAPTQRVLSEVFTEWTDSLKDEKNKFGGRTQPTPTVPQLFGLAAAAASEAVPEPMADAAPVAPVAAPAAAAGGGGIFSRVTSFVGVLGRAFFGGGGGSDAAAPASAPRVAPVVVPRPAGAGSTASEGRCDTLFGRPELGWIAGEGMCYDSATHALILADRSANKLWRLCLTNGTCTPLEGTSGKDGNGLKIGMSGTAARADWRGPDRQAFDPFAVIATKSGNIIVCEQYRHMVRMLPNPTSRLSVALPRRNDVGIPDFAFNAYNGMVNIAGDETWGSADSTPEKPFGAIESPSSVSFCDDTETSVYLTASYKVRRCELPSDYDVSDLMAIVNGTESLSRALPAVVWQIVFERAVITHPILSTIVCSAANQSIKRHTELYQPGAMVTTRSGRHAFIVCGTALQIFHWTLRYDWSKQTSVVVESQPLTKGGSNSGERDGPGNEARLGFYPRGLHLDEPGRRLFWCEHEHVVRCAVLPESYFPADEATSGPEPIEPVRPSPIASSPAAARNGGAAAAGAAGASAASAAAAAPPEPQITTELDALIESMDAKSFSANANRIERRVVAYKKWAADNKQRATAATGSVPLPLLWFWLNEALNETYNKENADPNPDQKEYWAYGGLITAHDWKSAHAAMKVDDSNRENRYRARMPVGRAAAAGGAKGGGGGRSTRGAVASASKERAEAAVPLYPPPEFVTNGLYGTLRAALILRTSWTESGDSNASNPAPADEIITILKLLTSEYGVMLWDFASTRDCYKALPLSAKQLDDAGSPPTADVRFSTTERLATSFCLAVLLPAAAMKAHGDAIARIRTGSNAGTGVIRIQLYETRQDD